MNIHAPGVNDSVYRHQEHAGNLSDIIKHLVLLSLQELPDVETIWDAFAADPYTLLSRVPDSRHEQLTALQSGTAPMAVQAFRKALRDCSREAGAPAYPGSSWCLSRYRAVRKLLLSDRQETCVVNQKACFSAVQYSWVRAASLDCYLQGERMMAEQPDLVFLDPPFLDAMEWQSLLNLYERLGERSPASRVVLWYPLRTDQTVPEAWRRLSRLELRVDYTGGRSLRGCVMALLHFDPSIVECVRPLRDWLVGPAPLPISGASLHQY